MMDAAGTEKLPFSLPADPAITKAELISANRDYLSNHVKLDFSVTNATFEPVILQSDDWFEVKVLVLHGESTDFEIKPIGEIAGVKAITFIGLNANEIPRSFWRESFAGGVRIQAVRTICYAVLLVFGMILIVLPIAAISDYRDKKNRKSQVARYLQSASKDLAVAEYSWVLEAYVERGSVIVMALDKWVKQPETLLLYLKNFDVGGFYVGREPRVFSTYHFAKRLKRSGLVHQDSGQTIVEPKFRAFVEDFIKSIGGDGVLSEKAQFYGGGEIDFPH